MTRLGFASALLGLLIIAGPAFAADLAPFPTKAPIAAATAPYDWNGFYFGGNFGGGWASTNYTSFRNTGDIATGSYSSNGVFGGGQIGFNHTLTPTLLIGVEADADLSDISGTTSTCGSLPVFVTRLCTSTNTKFEDFGTVRGRLGYTFRNLLLYGTGGWAWARSKSVLTPTCLGPFCPAISPGFLPPGLSASSSGMQSGWAAGGGIEWGFRPHWTIRVEYLHLQFDGIGRDFVFPTFPIAGAHNQENTGIDTVRVGVNYLTNWP